jgi:hypothetical protein
MKGLRFYYEVKSENKIYYLDENTNTFGSCYVNKKDLQYKYFHLFKEDEQTNEGLLQYKDNFNRWCEELKPHGIIYKKYYNHYSAVEFTFMRYSTKCSALIENEFPEVSFDEFKYNEACYNGGLIYLNPNYKNKRVQSYGYDFSSFYPNILVGNALKVPKSQGKQIKLNHLDFNNLYYGFYKVVVSCSNEEFLKVFAFSKRNVYTHFSLLFAYKYKHKFNIEFQLVTETDYNALIYDESELIASRDIFYSWYNHLYNKVKPNCNNPLSKRLLSSLWGSLTKCEKYYFDDEQDNHLSESEIGKYYRMDEKYFICDGKVKTRFECIKIEKPYKYHYGRMKAFLLSIGRNIVGDLIIESNILENVIRINTDGIVLNKPFDFSTINNSYYPKLEDKTTGFIVWENVNAYSKL